jgi:hypothetical protein
LAHPYSYDSPELPKEIEAAVGVYEVLAKHLHKIQELTGIPGLHTDINSDDDTPGVLERIQAMSDDGSIILEAFKDFD